MPFDEKFHLEMIELGLRERAAVQAADFLTDGDIEELRWLLSAPEREVPSLVREAMGDPERAGRLRLLVDYGFLDGLPLQDGTTAVSRCNPKAAWAVARHDRLRQREKEEAEERKRQRKIDRTLSVVIAIGSALFGWLLAQAGNIIALATAASGGQ